MSAGTKTKGSHRIYHNAHHSECCSDLPHTCVQVGDEAVQKTRRKATWSIQVLHEPFRWLSAHSAPPSSLLRSRAEICALQASCLSCCPPPVLPPLCPARGKRIHCLQLSTTSEPTGEADDRDSPSPDEQRGTGERELLWHGETAEGCAAWPKKRPGSAWLASLRELRLGEEEAKCSPKGPGSTEAWPSPTLGGPRAARAIAGRQFRACLACALLHEAAASVLKCVKSFQALGAFVFSFFGR